MRKVSVKKRVTLLVDVRMHVFEFVGFRPPPLFHHLHYGLLARVPSCWRLPRAFCNICVPIANTLRPPRGEVHTFLGHAHNPSSSRSVGE